MQTPEHELVALENRPVAEAVDVAQIYAAKKRFVWAALQRLGARHPAIDDLFQEVFLTVHRRLHTYRSDQPLEPWLFGICMRIVSNHRRLAYLRRERPSSDGLDSGLRADHTPQPERAVQQLQAKARVEEILSRMDVQRRAVFVMFELENLSCVQIAELVGIPVGTVYSRLDAARKQFKQALEAPAKPRKRAGRTP